MSDPWATVVLGVHVAAAATWVGGSVALGVVGITLRGSAGPDGRESSERVAEIGRNLGWVMWPALGIAILTGLYNLTWFLPPGGSIASSPQATVLWAKFLAIAVVLGTAGPHTFVVSPKVRRLRSAGAPATEIDRWRRRNLALAIASTIASFAVIFCAAALGAP